MGPSMFSRSVSVPIHMVVAFQLIVMALFVEYLNNNPEEYPYGN